MLDQTIIIINTWAIARTIAHYIGTKSEFTGMPAAFLIRCSAAAAGIVPNKSDSIIIFY